VPVPAPSPRLLLRQPPQCPSPRPPSCQAECRHHGRCHASTVSLSPPPRQRSHRDHRRANTESWHPLSPTSASWGFFFLVISFLTDKSTSSQVHDALPPRRQHLTPLARKCEVGGFAPMTSSPPYHRAATLSRPQARAEGGSFPTPCRCVATTSPRLLRCCCASTVPAPAPAPSLRPLPRQQHHLTRTRTIAAAVAAPAASPRPLTRLALPRQRRHRLTVTTTVPAASPRPPPYHVTTTTAAPAQSP
jgi:hypothetical protein